MMILLERVCETYNLKRVYLEILFVYPNVKAHDLLIRFTSSKMFLEEYDFLYDLYLK